MTKIPKNNKILYAILLLFFAVIAVLEIYNNEYWEIKDSAVRPTLVGLNSDEGTLIRSN